MRNLKSPALQQQFCQNVRALPRVAGSQFVAAGQPPSAIKTDPQTTFRGLTQLQGPPGQEELAYFILGPDGPARQVSKEEYFRTFPSLAGLAVSSVGKLSELTTGCS